jgi:hypothetical protein
MVDYMIAQIPNQIVNEYKSVGNKDFERSKMANDNYWKKKEFELKEKELLRHYDYELKLMNDKGPDGETYAEKVKKIQQNKKLTPQQVASEMAKAAVDFGLRETKRDPHKKTQVFTQMLPSYVQQKTLNQKPGDLYIDVWEPIYVKKNGKLVVQRDSKGQIRTAPKKITLIEMSKKRGGEFLDANGKVIQTEDIKNIQRAIKDNSVLLNPQNQQTYLVADNKRGGAETVTNLNINKLNLGKTGYAISTYGSAMVDKYVDAEGNEVPASVLPAGIHYESLLNDDVTRDALNQNYPSQSKGRDWERYEEYETTGTGSSESSGGGQR